jgi:hypothetical protein
MAGDAQGSSLDACCTIPLSTCESATLWCGAAIGPPPAREGGPDYFAGWLNGIGGYIGCCQGPLTYYKQMYAGKTVMYDGDVWFLSTQWGGGSMHSGSWQAPPYGGWSFCRALKNYKGVIIETEDESVWPLGSYCNFTQGHYNENFIQPDGLYFVGPDIELSHPATGLHAVTALSSASGVWYDPIMGDYATGPVCTVSGMSILRTDDVVPTSGLSALYVSNSCGNYVTPCTATGPVSSWDCAPQDEFCFREVLAAYGSPAQSMYAHNYLTWSQWNQSTGTGIATPAVNTFLPINLIYPLADLRTAILSGSFVQMVTGYTTFGSQPGHPDWPVWHNLPAQENYGAKPLYVWLRHAGVYGMESGPYVMTAEHPNARGGRSAAAMTLVAAAGHNSPYSLHGSGLGGGLIPGGPAGDKSGWPYISCSTLYNKNSHGIGYVYPARIDMTHGHSNPGNRNNPSWMGWWGYAGLSAGVGFATCTGAPTTAAPCTADCGLSGTCYEMHVCLSASGSSGVDSSYSLQVCDKDDYESINNGLSAGSFCTAIHCGTNMSSTGQLISVINPCSASEFVIASTCVRQDCECIWPNPPFSTNLCAISASGASDWMNGTWSSLNQESHNGLPVYYKQDDTGGKQAWMHYATTNPGFSPASWQMGDQHPSSGENAQWGYKNETSTSGTSPYDTTTQWTDSGMGYMYVQQTCGNAPCCGFGTCYILWPCEGWSSSDPVIPLSGFEVCDKDDYYATLWSSLSYLPPGQTDLVDTFVEVGGCEDSSTIRGRLISKGLCYDPTHYINFFCGNSASDCGCT